MAETSGDYLASLRALIQSEMIDLNTSIAAEIVSYSGGFASVRPLANKRFQDGDSLPFPIIHDVPVRWPVFAGGLAGVRGPISAGDKCHLVFAQQASDGTDDLRRHDLSDAYALIVDNSQSSQGANDNDMVIYFGSAYIKITRSGEIELSAPAGFKINTSKTVNNGALDVNGTTKTNESLHVKGEFTVNGFDVSENHTHSGVQKGGDNTGIVS